MPFRHVFGQVFPLESVIAAIVFGLVLAAMAAAVIVSWRKRRRGTPAARREHLRLLEAAYGLALAGIAAFLVVVSFSANAGDFPRQDPAPTMRVQVTAFQWCWRFHYAGQPLTVTGSCAGGDYPVLVLPAGLPVELDLTPADGGHPFWVPYLDCKTDALPGRRDS